VDLRSDDGAVEELALGREAKAGQQSGILAVLYFALKDKLRSDAPFVYDNDSIYDSRTRDRCT